MHSHDQNLDDAQAHADDSAEALPLRFFHRALAERAHGLEIDETYARALGLTAVANSLDDARDVILDAMENLRATTQWQEERPR